METQEKLEKTLNAIMKAIEENELTSVEVIHIAEELKIMAYTSMFMPHEIKE